MADRSAGLLLVPVVALIALAMPGLTGGRPAERQAASAAGTEPPSAEPAEGVSRPRTAADLRRDYWSVQPQTAPPPANPAQEGPLPSTPCIIATLPDPRDAANLNYMFDRYLDAIQRAMEAAGFVLDRFDMPWLDSDEKMRFRVEPGRLLFRGGISTGRPVPPTALVWIIGETPTGGIHKPAFALAVSELTANCADGATAPIPVLGPSFSGSQSSLRTILQAHGGRTFRIVAGSATAVNSEALTVGTGSTFQTTIARDDGAQELFRGIVDANERRRPLKFLRSLATRLFRGTASTDTRVALLVEGNTSFGNVTGRAVHPRVTVVRLPFPLHISRLRESAQGREPADLGAFDLSLRRHGLTKLDLRQKANARTVIPLTSHVETSSLETVLATLLETLDEEDLRYVGVVATDVQDLIFLSQQIKHHLPNSQLFLFTGDLLFLHPDVNLDLRGAQIISPYPLFPRNQEWTRRQDAARLLFPSHTAQGVYNAALVLLGLPDAMQEYGYPLRAGKTLPLWQSVVGADNIWPVRLYDRPRDGDLFVRAETMQPRFRVSTPNHPWLAVMALALGGVPALFVIANLRNGANGRLRKCRTGTLAELFSDEVFEVQHRTRRLHLFHCWTGLTTAYVVVAGILLLPWAVAITDPSIEWTRAEGYRVLELALLAGMVLMLGVLVMLTWRVLIDRNAARAPILRAAPLAPVLLAAGLTAVWLWSGENTGAAAVLLYLRSTELDSGVSPLVPILLLCAAGIIWSVCSLRRLRRLEGPNQYPARGTSTCAPASFLGFEGRSFEGIVALEERVRRAVGRRSTELPKAVFWGIVGATALAGAGLFERRGVPSAEGSTFDTLFAIGFMVITIAIALSFVRFLIVWRSLLHLLRRLAWHPTIKAYDRLATRIPGKPKINLTAQSQIFTALEFSVDRAGEMVARARELTEQKAATPSPLAQLTRLLSPPPAASPQFTSDIRKQLPVLEENVRLAQEALHCAFDAAAAGDWRQKIKARTVAEQHLSCLATTVTALVLPGWRLPADYWVRAGSEKPDEVAWFELAEDFLTSRVAAFLSHIVPQLQNLVVCVTSGLILLLLAVTTYPFQPRQLLLMFTTTIIVIAVGTTLVVFVQMERETILSALSETVPGQVSWSRDFVSRILVYVLLPLLGVLSAQFPEATHQLFAWTRSIFGPH